MTRSFDYGTQADGVLCDADDLALDEEIIPESNDADDDSFPPTLTGGVDADVEDSRSDAAVERRLTRGES